MNLKEMTYLELLKLYNSLSLEMFIRTWWILLFLLLVVLGINVIKYWWQIKHWFVYRVLVKRGK